MPKSEADILAAKKSAYLHYFNNIRKTKLGYISCGVDVWITSALDDEYIDVQSFVSLCVFAYAD